MGIEIETEDSMTYKFFPVQTQALKLNIKAPHDAHVALTSGPVEANPMYEIFIGGWENTKIAIRRNREKPDVTEVSKPDTLKENTFVGFWITFYDKIIAIGINDDATPLVQWPDPELFNITHFGVRTSWGAKGVWQIEDNWAGWRVQPTPGIGWSVDQPMTGNGTWVGATAGSIPPNALSGGFDNEPLFIGRAIHNGALLPGKIIPSHGVCYVAWGGSEHAIAEYEVLCDCPGTWLRTSGLEIPPTAIPGGKTEDGETLYIGRAEHEQSVTIGKVQKSHAVCYIPFGGQEIAKQDYEILVVS